MNSKVLKTILLIGFIISILIGEFCYVQYAINESNDLLLIGILVTFGFMIFAIFIASRSLFKLYRKEIE